MADLATPRFLLRLMGTGPAGAVDADAALYRELYTSPEVMAHIGPPLAAEAADTAFGRVARHNGRDAPGHRYWAITAREDGAPLGLAALQRDGDRAELGVMLVPPAWNRRVSSECFVAVLAHAFGPMGLATVDAERADDAHAAVIDRLLAPFGFTRVPPTRPGLARWALHRARWLVTQTAAESA